MVTAARAAYGTAFERIPWMKPRRKWDRGRHSVVASVLSKVGMTRAERRKEVRGGGFWVMTRMSRARGGTGAALMFLVLILENMRRVKTARVGVGDNRVL